MPLLRTLLVDDDDLVREALGLYLSRQKCLNVVGSVSTGEEAIIAADSLMPDLILLDLCLPGLSGMDAMRSIINSLRRVRIIVLSATRSLEKVQQAFDAGAAGYVFKPSSGVDLPDAVQAVIARRRYVSPAIRGSVAAADAVRISFSDAPLASSSAS